MKTIIYTILALIGLFFIWDLNRERLSAYNDCAMYRTEVDWNYDCELGPDNLDI